MARDGYLPVIGATEESIPEDPFRQRDLFLTNRIAETIDLHYPGHPWKVIVSHQQGVVRIQIPHFMGVQNWYVIKIKNLTSDPGLRRVVRACGEILERYQIPRSNFSRDHFVNALNAIPQNKRGRIHGYVPN